VQHVRIVVQRALANVTDELAIAASSISPGVIGGAGTTASRRADARALAG
jgi:hypothetical protein